jgi:gluconokinase
VIIVVMGVSGSGKTKIGRTLAASLDWPFYDADDLHPPENVAKMSAGIPLTDDDRWPWLDRIVEELTRAGADGGNAVLACSALRQVYRDRLARAGDVHFVYLKGDLETIAARLAARSHKYMPASLLPSQFATLEEPTDALVIDIRADVAEKIAAIRSGLKLPAADIE